MIRKKMGGSVLFRFTSPAKGPVYLVGDFNDWNERSHPMRKEEGGTWSLKLALRPGRYHYKYYCRGEWFNDPEAEAYGPNPWGSCDSEVRIVESVETEKV